MATEAQPPSKKRRITDDEDEAVRGPASRALHTPSKEASALTMGSQKLSAYEQRDESLRSLISCKICFRTLYEPYILGCGHTFCYSCLCQWFESGERRKKTCPDCRAPVLTAPAPAYALREIVREMVARPELLPEGETVEDHERQKREEQDLVDGDRSNVDVISGGLFKGRFAPRKPINQLPIWDEADGVHRCPNCAHELEDEHACSHCDWELDDDEALERDIEDYLDEEDSDSGTDLYSGAYSDVDFHSERHLFADYNGEDEEGEIYRPGWSEDDGSEQWLDALQRGNANFSETWGERTRRLDSEDEEDDEDEDEDDSSLRDFVTDGEGDEDSASASSMSTIGPSRRGNSFPDSQLMHRRRNVRVITDSEDDDSEGDSVPRGSSAERANSSGDDIESGTSRTASTHTRYDSDDESTSEVSRSPSVEIVDERRHSERDDDSASDLESQRWHERAIEPTNNEIYDVNDSSDESIRAVSIPRSSGRGGVRPRTSEPYPDRARPRGVNQQRRSAQRVRGANPVPISSDSDSSGY